MTDSLLIKLGFKRRTRGIMLLAVLLLGIPSFAHAHAIAVYVSTPVTPPRGWLWVPVVFVIGIIILDYAVLRNNVQMRRLAWRALALLGIFFFIFFAIGSCAANRHTGPPPGLGPPHKAFYGFSWERVGGLFVFWNLIGLAFLLSAKSFLYRQLGILRSRRAPVLLLGNAGAYALALVPFILSNALTHGWTGSYVQMECRNRLNAMGAGLVRYADAHDGCLPDADTTEEVMRAIEPYLPSGVKEWDERIDVCPAEEAYSRNPRPYDWNATFAGASLDQSTEPDASIPVLRCRTEYDAGEVFAGTVRSNRSLYFRDLIKLRAVIDAGEPE